MDCIFRWLKLIVIKKSVFYKLILTIRNFCIVITNLQSMQKVLIELPTKLTYTGKVHVIAKTVLQIRTIILLAPGFIQSLHFSNFIKIKPVNNINF